MNTTEDQSLPDDNIPQQQQQQEEYPTTISNNNNIILQDENEKLQMTRIAVEELSQAFETVFVPTMNNIDVQLNEISQSQLLLLDLIREQNQDWQNMPHVKEIERIFNKIPLYLQKTRDTSKRMASTTVQIESLKKRTEKLREKQLLSMK